MSPVQHNRITYSVMCFVLYSLICREKNNYREAPCKEKMDQTVLLAFVQYLAKTLSLKVLTGPLLRLSLFAIISFTHSTHV